MAAFRLCFVGDSITTGVGDGSWNGWPIRLCAAGGRHANDLTPYNLGVRGDTSEDIRRRWRAECEPRLAAPWRGGIVFAFGVNDACRRDAERRVPLARSLDNARAIIGAAAAWKPTLWIGPASVDPARQPCRVVTNGVPHEFENHCIGELSDGFGAIARELRVPYLDLYRNLCADQHWNAALARGDGVHPDDRGHRRIAEEIDAWPDWHAWLWR